MTIFLLLSFCVHLIFCVFSLFFKYFLFVSECSRVLLYLFVQGHAEQKRTNAVRILAEHFYLCKVIQHKSKPTQCDPCGAFYVIGISYHIKNTCKSVITAFTGIYILRSVILFTILAPVCLHKHLFHIPQRHDQCQCLRSRKCQPYTGHAKECCEHQCTEYDHHKAAQHGS